LKLTIKGFRGKQKKLIEKAIPYYLEVLVGPRLTNNLMVHVINLPKKERDQTQADIVWEDSNYKPREFTIRIDNGLKIRPLLMGLAHECVHIKQFARGEWVHLLKNGAQKWQGVILPEGIDYWDNPAEIEAYGRELGLFFRFIKAAGYDNETWAQFDDHYEPQPTRKL